jgi:hypothetical protein
MSLMKPMKLMLICGGAVAAVAAISARGREPAVSMHDLDWLDGAGVTAPRRYRSPGHVLHHALELAGASLPLARVYVLRAIPPSLREQVMIVTAMSNACPV